MNFLAHAYLSFGDPDILVGNMIADLIKGKQIEKYSQKIQHGIHVHRQIDAFTDKHALTHKTTKVFRESAEKYAGPFLDVAYDHFLALDRENEPASGWEIFAQESYKQIENYTDILPPEFCRLFKYMKEEDWFYNYRFKWLIEESFDNLKRRANYLNDDAPVFQAFESHYQEIEDSYKLFFPELKDFVKSIL